MITVDVFSDLQYPVALPVAAQTWQQHFVDNGWSRIDDQLRAGYTRYAQPTPPYARARWVADLKALLPEPVTIDLSVAVDAVDGNVSLTPTIETSPDKVTWTSYAGTWRATSREFRYVRASVEAMGADRKSLVKVREFRLRLTTKERTDAGIVAAKAADGGGTLVTLTKTFADIRSIVATPKMANDNTDLQAGVDFDDTPNPTHFRVFLVRRSDGVRVDGDVSWIVRGI